MELGWYQRTRVSLGRPIARFLMGSGAIRRRLLEGRAARVTEEGLDPDLAAMLALDAYTKDSHLWALTPEAARAKVAESIAIADDPPPGDVTVREIAIPGPAGELAARVYEPAGLSAASPGMVYVHGGGWVTCDLDTHDPLCRRIALDGELRVVSIAYRLAPEHRFPAAADDSLAAFRWVAVHAGELGIDPARIAIGGDSAGGNLSAVVSLDTRGDAIRPALQVLLYPALDATCSRPSYAELADGYYLTKRAADWYYAHYLGDDAALRTHPRASPLHAEHVRGAPPALLAIARFDPLRDEGIAYAARLREAGVPVDERVYPSFIHGFALMSGLCPAGLEATRTLARDVGRRLREAT